MKPVLIVENSTNQLNVESSGSKKEYKLGGIFTEFDVLNRNERIYTAEKFIPALDEMNERISTMGVVYGEFDHPDVFDTSLSRASHLITKANYVKENNRVEGEIKLLSTYWGKEAKALVDDDCPIFVSSRAAGVTESNGTVSLKKLFTYDIVADPGFASAKMSSINESLGYKVDSTSNFRIYEISNESKINDLFKMNKNDYVTNKQLGDYSKYLITEIAKTRSQVDDAIKGGTMNPDKLDKLMEYYEELNVANDKMVKYLDYLADKVQVMFNENKSLKDTTSKLISHNDYLAENLQKSVDYSEYLAEKLDKNIEYSEYIAENLDKNIAYSEYIAENLDNVIDYSEYIAENVKNNIAYSEYIAEHLDDNIAYSEYIAENLDKSVSYVDMISERLKTNKLFESNGVEIPSVKEFGFESILENIDEDETDCPSCLHEEELVDNVVDTEEDVIVDSVDTEVDTDVNMEEEKEEESIYMDDDSTNEVEEEMTYEGNSDTELSKNIDKLIEEAKKRKVSESNDLHFLNFLNKSQVDSYYELSSDDQENVKLYINEKSYYSNSDVLRLISECLSIKNESLEERLVRLMPDSIKPMWSQLNESSKKSILSQGRLYPDLNTEDKVEHFWLTRPFKKNESVSKKIVSHESLIQEDKLSDNEVNSIMERFKNV